MSVGVKITSVTASDGERIGLPVAGVTCIVGSNNAGKSRSLRDIVGLLSSSSVRTKAITRITTHRDRSANVEQVEAWLEENAALDETGNSDSPQYRPTHGGVTATSESVLSGIARTSAYMGHTAAFFVWHASAGSLLNFATPGLGALAMTSQAHPLARLFRDGALESELSELSRDAFGEGLVLDRVNGDVRLRMGTVHIPVPPMNAPTLEYANAVRNLPTLESQGDGVKSFLGLALNVVAGGCTVFIVDEPEAFLHPGQARALGRWLARRAYKRDLQVITATHDRDFLLGLLEGGENSSTSVIRVVRDGEVNHLYQLKPNELAAVWADPVLRYSNVLQGLFHKKVVICEADADCRFYGAVLDGIGAEPGLRAVVDDVLFVPSGGKQRVAALAQALSRLGVQATTVMDFDALRVRADVRLVVEAVGAEWTSDDDADYVEFARVANEGSAWESLKRQGYAALPSGGAFNAAVRLIKSLAAKGILIVPVGEMEDFNKSIGAHGAAWVSAMLESGGHRTCEEARALCRQILQGQRPSAAALLHLK